MLNIIVIMELFVAWAAKPFLEDILEERTIYIHLNVKLKAIVISEEPEQIAKSAGMLFQLLRVRFVNKARSRQLTLICF